MTRSGDATPRSWAEKIVPIHKQFYRTERDENLVASKRALIPFIGFLRIAQVCVMAVMVWYYSSPAEYVTRESFELSWNAKPDPFNCTPMVADSLYRSFMHFSTCEKYATPVEEGMVNTSTGWTYKPFAWIDQNVAVVAELYDDTSPFRNFNQTAGDVAFQEIVREMRTLTTCGADGNLEISKRTWNGGFADWEVGNFDGFWEQGSDLTGFPLTSYNGGPCRTYDADDIHDLTALDSCYYNHSHPSMRDLFVYLGLPETTTDKRNWDCDNRREHAIASGSACSWGYPRDEDRPSRAYARDKRFVSCAVSRDEAATMFQTWRNKTLCDMTKNAAVYRCQGDVPRPALEILSLSFSNSMLFYAVFSALAVWLFKNFFRRTKAAESERKTMSLWEKIVPIDDIWYDDLTDENLVAPKRRIIPFVVFLRFIQVCSFGAFVLYYTAPVAFVEDNRIETVWNYEQDGVAYNCTPMLRDPYLGGFYNYDTCKAYAKPPNDANLVEQLDPDNPHSITWSYKPFTFLDAVANAAEDSFVRFGTSVQRRAAIQNFSTALAALNSVGNDDAGFMALIMDNPLDYKIWEISNNTGITRQEALAMFNAFYEWDLVCSHLKTEYISYRCKGQLPLSTLKVMSLAFSNSLLVFTVFSMACVSLFMKGSEQASKETQPDSSQQVVVDIPNEAKSTNVQQQKSLGEKLIPITKEYYKHAEDDLVASKKKIIPFVALLRFVQVGAFAGLVAYYASPVAYTPDQTIQTRSDYRSDTYNCSMLMASSAWGVKLSADACTQLAAPPALNSTVLYDNLAWSYKPFYFIDRVASVDQEDYDGGNAVHATAAEGSADRTAMSVYLKTLNSVQSDGGYLAASYRWRYEEAGWYINSTLGITESEALAMFQAYYDRGYVCLWTKVQSVYVCDGKVPEQPLVIMSLAYSNSLLLFTIFSSIAVKLFKTLVGKPSSEASK